MLKSLILLSLSQVLMNNNYFLPNNLELNQNQTDQKSEFLKKSHSLSHFLPFLYVRECLGRFLIFNLHFFPQVQQFLKEKNLMDPEMPLKQNDSNKALLEQIQESKLWKSSQKGEKFQKKYIENSLIMKPQQVSHLKRELLRALLKFRLKDINYTSEDYKGMSFVLFFQILEKTNKFEHAYQHFIEIQGLVNQMVQIMKKEEDITSRVFIIMSLLEIKQNIELYSNNSSEYKEDMLKRKKNRSKVEEQYQTEQE